MDTNTDPVRAHDELRVQAALLRTPEFMAQFDPDKFAGQLERIAAALARQPAAVAQPAGGGCHCGTCTCNPNMTPAVRFDLSPAQMEGAIRDHLIRLGWTPPDEHAKSQPAEGEEIMVNTPYDVFILPLQPSGLSSGPRFVVHVPEPAQKFKVGDRVVACETFYHDEVQGIRVGAYGTVRESRYNGEIFLVDFDGITPSKGHDGAWEMFAHQLELAPDTRPAALAAQQGGRDHG